MTSTTTTTFDTPTTIAVAAVSSPSSSPLPSTGSHLAVSKLSHWTFPSVPVIDTSFDIITIALILCFIFFSLLCLTFVFHLRIKSRHFFTLNRFSSHWAPRFLLVVLLSLWSINEFFRLPVFRKNYIFPFLPSLPLSQQTQFCKLHLILSFGLYEPGFLVVVLFLVNISIKERSPGNLWAIGFVAIICLPLMIAVYLTVYVLPSKLYLPPIFYRSAILLEDENIGAQIVYCTYPLLVSLVFTVFGALYALVFLASCWKVIALIINKRLKARVNVLVWTVMVCLTTQALLMIISAFWDPVQVWYYICALLIFMSIVTCGSVIEGILVIMPTTDSLQVACSTREEEREFIDEFV